MSPDGRARITARLSATYPGMADGQITELLRLLAGRDEADLLAAVDEHVMSDAGKWPPVAGQMSAIITAREIKRRGAVGPRAPRWGSTMVSVPPHLRAWMGGADQIEVWKSNCSHCADTGMAWYYVERIPEGGRPPRIYEAEEALSMPEAMFARLRPQKAVCDCDAGLERPERRVQVTRYPSGQGGLWRCPDLGDVRQAAHERRRGELATLGV